MNRINHILNELCIKEAGLPASLYSYRSTVEDIDYEIYKLLERRFEITNEIGRIKKKEGIPIEDLKVEANKLAAVPDMLKSIYQEIFKVSKQCQNTIE